MDIFACIKTRRSIRCYLDIPVEWDKVGEVLEAGRFSPTSGNIQDWNFIVVKDEDKRLQRRARLWCHGSSSERPSVLRQRHGRRPA